MRDAYKQYVLRILNVTLNANYLDTKWCVLLKIRLSRRHQDEEEGSSVTSGNRL